MGDNFEPQAPFQVVLTGTAKQGKPGPDGYLDIGENEVAYIFRVALPDVIKDQCELSIELERNGKVHLQGVIKEPKTVYQMSVTQLNPPGPFTASFQLPGPVDPRLFSTIFRSDGVFEGIVIKYKAHGVPPCGPVCP